MRQLACCSLAIALSFTASMLTGCATLFSGGPQPINVTSDPPGATFQYGIYNGKTPDTIQGIERRACTCGDIHACRLRTQDCARRDRYSRIDLVGYSFCDRLCCRFRVGQRIQGGRPQYKRDAYANSSDCFILATRVTRYSIVSATTV